MTNFQAHGAHVFLDYTEYVSPKANDGEWILEVLEKAVERSNARNVHSHVEQFDGSIHPLVLQQWSYLTRATSPPIAILRRVGLP